MFLPGGGTGGTLAIPSGDKGHLFGRLGGHWRFANADLNAPPHRGYRKALPGAASPRVEVGSLTVRASPWFWFWQMKNETHEKALVGQMPALTSGAAVGLREPGSGGRHRRARLALLAPLLRQHVCLALLRVGRRL